MRDKKVSELRGIEQWIHLIFTITLFIVSIWIAATCTKHLLNWFLVPMITINSINLLQAIAVRMTLIWMVNGADKFESQELTVKQHSNLYVKRIISPIIVLIIGWLLQGLI